MKYAVLAANFDSFLALADFAGPGNYDPFDAPSEAVEAVVSKKCDALLLDTPASLSSSPQELAAAISYVVAYGGSVVTPDGTLGGSAS